MVRGFFGIVLGYLVIFGVVFLSFTVAYLVLGADRTFLPGTYEVSMLWLGISFGLAFVAAVIGGLVCTIIARGYKAALILVILIIVMGVALALPTMNQVDAGKKSVRDATVGNLEAMMNAKQPTWVALLNPVIGAVGVFLGSRLKGSFTRQ